MNLRSIGPFARAAAERLLALGGLAAAFPLIAIAAIAVMVEDGRPVLFRQTRVGRGGRRFSILKLRTMRLRMSGTPVTGRGDRRVTRVGSLLRRYKLDELPQLWNVCRGDMSLIGPRPEVPEFVDMTDPAWQMVLSARPGITDVATLVFRDEEELLAGASDPVRFYRETILPKKMQINIRHLDGRSFIGDLRILMYTVLCSLFPGHFESNIAIRIAASSENA